MRMAMPALLLLLASQAGAQSFVSMGRLFTTPGERVQLDTQRNQAGPPGAAAGAHGPAAAGAHGVPGVPGTVPAAVPGTLPDGAQPPGAGMADGDASSCPPGSAPGCPPLDAAAAATQGTGAQEPPGLRLDGVIRRSHGRTMLIVNGEVQPAPAGAVSRGTVRLQADGRSVVLRPGQRYDPATGAIHEAAR